MRVIAATGTSEPGVVCENICCKCGCENARVAHNL